MDDEVVSIALFFLITVIGVLVGIFIGAIVAFTIVKDECDTFQSTKIKRVVYVCQAKESLR
jgi:hypothetical protein